MREIRVRPTGVGEAASGGSRGRLGSRVGRVPVSDELGATAQGNPWFLAATNFAMRAWGENNSSSQSIDNTLS
jgi:hypothetical protein